MYLQNAHTNHQGNLLRSKFYFSSWEVGPEILSNKLTGTAHAAGPQTTLEEARAQDSCPSHGPPESHPQMLCLVKGSDN